MQKYLSILVAMFLAGCLQPQVITPNRVTMVDQRFNYPFVVTEVKTFINSGGLMEVQAQGFNQKKYYKTLEYRISWYNQHGTSIFSSRNNIWSEFPVFRNQDFEFVAVAPNTKAKDFKIYIRDPEKNSYNVYTSKKP